jgi:signal transduction histidine kinase
LTALGGIIVSIDIVHNYQDFNIRADKMRTDYVEQQKQMIKREVERVVDMINHEKAQSMTLAKTEVRSRVYEAYSIVQNIYEQNKGLKSDAEIQKMIADALRPVCFNDGKGYYFIDSLSGENILYPPYPSFEGQNIVDLQDSRGEYIVKKEFELLREKGEGFVTGYWSKPAEDLTKDFKKITFLKLFKPYAWSIGTGLYVADVEEQIKEKLIGQINNIRFDKNGYIFVDDWRGVSLAHGAQPDLIGTDMWECEDSKGIKTTQSLIAASKKEDGGYVYYWWRKPDTGKERPKIAYAKGVPEWKWCVGTGVYQDDVEQDIATLQAVLNAQTKSKIFVFIIIGITAFSLFLILFNWLSNLLRRDFNLFVSFFNRAAISDKQIDRGSVRFVEFDKMAEYANKMLQDKVIAQQDLLDEK